MAKRLKTRLSAGAALVTGLGMMGLATAVPAQADTTLTYSCTTDGQSRTFDFTLASGAQPAAPTVGDRVTFTPTGTVALDAATVASLQDGGMTSIDGDIPGMGITVDNGTQSTDVSTDIAIAKTSITADTTSLPLSGAVQTVDASQAGTYTISAPDTFTATLTGYDDADTSLGSLTFSCAYDSGSKVIDTITVTDAPAPPEVDDWFDEPGSLRLVDNVFTVTGDATHAGTLTVQVLGGAKDADGKAIPGDVLKSYTMSAVEGANSADFELVEGANYVRVLSQDCVDEGGNDMSVVGGCNVLYTAPWAEDGTDDGTGTDDGAADPERPSVVQTDGFTRMQEPAGNNTATLLLGGALLVGAGAGSVVLARRRQSAQR